MSFMDHEFSWQRIKIDGAKEAFKHADSGRYIVRWEDYPEDSDGNCTGETEYWWPYDENFNLIKFDENLLKSYGLSQKEARRIACKD